MNKFFTPLRGVCGGVAESKRPDLCLLLGLLAILAQPASGQVRISANYAVGAEGLEPSFEAAATSVDYTVEATVDVLGGASSEPITDTLARHAFKGALYEVGAVEVEAAPESVNEGSNAQLSGIATYGDDTISELSGAEITGWSIDSGPLVTIDSGGNATAGTVFADTLAAFSGSYQGITDTGTLMVVNTDPDNYSDYGGDGLDDNFQVQFFGEPPNADAAPGADPDADGQNNAFEETAGFSPLDGGSFFDVRIISLSDGTANLSLNKVLPGRDYIIKAGTDLSSFSAIGTVNVSEEEENKEIPDPSVSGDMKFYKVEITKP